LEKSTKDNLIKEELSFFQKSVRYLKELFLSFKNIPYEIAFNKNIPKVKTINETVNLLLKGSSITRFGDGEFRIINGFSIPYQKYDKNLQKRLKQIFQEKIKNLLIGLPETFSTLDQFTFPERIFWRKYMVKNRDSIYKLIDLKQDYVSAFFSRPYLRYKNKKNISQIFKKIKKIWNKKNVLIIEGNGTRIGVGNSLLNNVSSIKRIICPDINAFNKYNQILKKTISCKSDLVLLALGPTAKILAFDLTKNGIQAIDIGHLDIEYEWFLKKTRKRVPINNKNVLESNSYSVGKCLDKNYQKQIISVIK